MLGFGLGMGAVFPPFAALFVTVDPGMWPPFVAGCFAAGAVVGVANFALASRLVGAHLRRLNAVADQLKDGRLDARMEVVGDDVFGALAGHINLAVGAMRDAVETARQVACRVAVSSSEVTEMSDAVAHGVEGIQRELARAEERLGDVSREVQGAARNAGDVSGRARDLQGLMGDVEGALGEVARTAAEVGRDASATTGLLSEGAQGIVVLSRRAGEAAESTAKAAAEAQEAQEIVTRLQADAEGAEEIVGEVEGIAKHIRLLSVNATVEAARAGSAGRAFGVVAEEVRELAARTAAVTRRVRETLVHMGGGAGRSRQALQRVAARCGDGHAQAQGVAGDLSVQAANLTALSDRVRDAAARIEQAGQRVVAVHEGGLGTPGVRHAADWTREVAAAMGELERFVAATAERVGQVDADLAGVRDRLAQQVATAEEAMATAAELRGASGGLEGSLGRFHTGGPPPKCKARLHGAEPASRAPVAPAAPAAPGEPGRPARVRAATGVEASLHHPTLH